MKPHISAITLTSLLALVGCGNQADQDAGAHTSAERMEREAAAAALERNYEQARAAGLWTQALSYADQLERTASGSDSARAMQTTLNDTKQRAEKAKELQRLISQWSYVSKLPDLDTAGGVVVSASIHSMDRQGPTTVKNARLVLLRHPTAGRSMYLSLDEGQFSCVPACKVQVRFDDEPSRAFAARSSESNRKSLVIDEEQPIRDRLDSSRVVTFSAIVDGRPRQLAFEVGGFDRVQFEHQLR